MLSRCGCAPRQVAWNLSARVLLLLTFLCLWLRGGQFPVALNIFQYWDLFEQLFADSAIILRYRRQAPLQRPAPFRPRREDYNVPPFYQPFPGRDASSLSPVFPFTT